MRYSYRVQDYQLFDQSLDICQFHFGTHLKNTESKKVEKDGSPFDSHLLMSPHACAPITIVKVLM